MIEIQQIQFIGKTFVNIVVNTRTLHCILLLKFEYILL